MNWVRTITVLILFFAIPFPALSAGDPYFTRWKNIEEEIKPGVYACSIYSSAFGSDIEMVFAVKTRSDRPGLYLGLYKNSWNIPDGREIEVNFGFHQKSPAKFFKLKGHGGGAIFDVLLSEDKVSDFLEEMLTNLYIVVTFSSGTERLWRVDTLGLADMFNQFVLCDKKYHPERNIQIDLSPHPTQPF